MAEWRYELESGKPRIKCPSCGKCKVFTPYIDTWKGDERLPEQYGICKRSDHCGYHLNPYKDNYQGDNVPISARPKYVKPEPSFHGYDIYKSSLRGYQDNNFCKFIKKTFGEDRLKEVIDRYQIGTSRRGCIFWQIDAWYRIHAGKIIQYDPLTGHRNKYGTTWVHYELGLKDFVLNQCFFGEHLLYGSKKPVAICESEKTAVIASMFIPEFIWLASGGKDGLSKEKCSALKGHDVTLFPDSGVYDKWLQTGYKTSNFLEGREVGFDLADYLIQSQFKYLSENL
jgi:Domain of unknown function (DUF6371)